MTSEYIARRFNLGSSKGCIAIGVDADLVLVDLAAQGILHERDLYYRHQHSPYVGRTLQGCIRRTLVRGTTVFQDGVFNPTPIGRLITPAKDAA